MNTLSSEYAKLYTTALLLALFTVFYNLAEGLLAVWFGFEDETLTLFGFGIDSFIEMLSGIGIMHMIWRIRNAPEVHPDNFERTALKITGSAFYLLVAGLIAGSILVVATNQKPQSTFWGIIISALSIAVMLLLMRAKQKVGRKLNSEAMLADANCTRVCIYMSVVLLAASGMYELTSLPYLDAAGSLGLAWFSFKEGRECFAKASSGRYDCCRN
ncbi:MAG: membrane protein [Cyclobacteriaceae bacterium]|nr:MAG: membrane protein [Cyclobacteriaceae bacterium]